jgi:hypothetical protein
VIFSVSPVLALPFDKKNPMQSGDFIDYAPTKPVALGSDFWYG